MTSTNYNPDAITAPGSVYLSTAGANGKEIDLQTIVSAIGRSNPSVVNNMDDNTGDQSHNMGAGG